MRQNLHHVNFLKDKNILPESINPSNKIYLGDFSDFSIVNNNHAPEDWNFNEEPDFSNKGIDLFDEILIHGKY